MNRATENINTQIPLLYTYFDLLGFIPGSDITESYGSTTVSLFNERPYTFP
jgi:hypothetical protein